MYWLVAGDQPGKRVAQQPVSGAPGEEPSSYPYVLELKQRTTYFAALLKENTDNFFGALVSSAPAEEVLNIRNIADASGPDIRLTIALQGVVEGTPHDVRVSWNGTTLGNLNFVGKRRGRALWTCPASLYRKALTPLR